MFAVSIKWEGVLRIQKDWVGMQNYFNELEEFFGVYVCVCVWGGGGGEKKPETG